MMRLSSFLVAALLAPLSSLAALPAHADISPPHIVPARPRFPAQATTWFESATSAMKSEDKALAQRLCDARGFSENLVGGSGTPLEDLFAQGARKHWHLVADHSELRHLPAGRGLIVRATVVDDADGKELDALHLLLVTVKNDDGTFHYLALGAGEEREQVRALADRFLAGQPLAPTPDKPAPATE